MEECILKLFLKRIFTNLKDAIFPDNYTCIICNDELNEDLRYGICDKCNKSIQYIDDRACVKCGAKLLADSTVCTDCKNNERIIERNYSVVVYDGKMRKLIHDFKYSNKRYLKKFLGAMLYDKYREVVEEFRPDIIVAVPLHKDRLRDRGYNQTELLLSMFAGDKEKIVLGNLVRVKDTPHLASMTKEMRRDKIKNSFAVVDEQVFKNKKVMIIDDVYTSGATIDECARVLYKSGAKVVCSLTLANSHIEQPLGRKKK